MKLVEILGGVAIADDNTFIWDWDSVNEMTMAEKLDEALALIKAFELPPELLTNTISEFMENVLRIARSES